MNDNLGKLPRCTIVGKPLFLSLINSHNQQASVTYSPFASINNIDVSTIATEADWTTKLSNAPFVQRLTLQGNAGVSGDVINKGLKTLPFLTHVTFMDFEDAESVALSIEGLSKIQGFSCQAHENLIEGNTNVSPIIKQLAISSPLLEKLEIKGKVSIEGTVGEKYPLVTLSKNCTALKKLHLPQELQILIGIKEFLEKVVPKNITELSFAHNDLETVHMQYLTLKCRQMQVLRVDSAGKLDPKILANIYRLMTQLTLLEIHGLDTDDRMFDFTNMSLSLKQPAKLGKEVFKVRAS
jgi:hypothetical protein